MAGGACGIGDEGEGPFTAPSRAQAVVLLSGAAVLQGGYLARGHSLVLGLVFGGWLLVLIGLLHPRAPTRLFRVAALLYLLAVLSLAVCTREQDLPVQVLTLTCVVLAVVLRSARARTRDRVTTVIAAWTLAGFTWLLLILGDGFQVEPQALGFMALVLLAGHRRPYMLVWFLMLSYAVLVTFFSPVLSVVTPGIDILGLLFLLPALVLRSAVPESAQAPVGVG